MLGGKEQVIELQITAAMLDYVFTSEEQMTFSVFMFRRFLLRFRHMV